MTLAVLSSIKVLSTKLGLNCHHFPSVVQEYGGVEQMCECKPQNIYTPSGIPVHPGISDVVFNDVEPIGNVSTEQ